jgi:light-regulated signal transduction histidine kinase (bacteriophytochrome)
MNTQSVDLTNLAHAVSEELRESNPGRDIEFAIQPGLSAVGDAGLMEVALTNLLSNAVKFTGKRASARVAFGQMEDGTNAFYVRDNGVGFDMAYADMLFGAFQRLHKASEFPGTGIGLATVQRIVRRHGGRVWAEARPNEGATFYFVLASN